MAAAGVPPIVCLFLVALSFICGGIVFRPPAVAPTVTETVERPAARKQLAQPSIIQRVQQIKETTINPLDPAELEAHFFKSTGLLDVRPPLPAAESGDAFTRVIPYQILSWAPRIVNFPAFIDRARCEAIIRMANHSLHKSGLAFGKNQKDVKGQENVRTSSGTFLSSNERSDSEGVLAWLEERIAAATLIPASHGEAFNVLRYENGQHYESHMDTFDPNQFGPMTSQRIATMLIYLTDVEEGGETIFKKEGLGNENKGIRDFKSCNDGYKYKPRQGDAVLFWATYPGSTDIDPQALHGGCDTIKGEKWVATKWMRNKKASYDRLAELAKEKH